MVPVWGAHMVDLTVRVVMFAAQCMDMLSILSPLPESERE